MKNKRRLLFAVCGILALAALVFLVVLHLPEKIETTVRIVPDSASEKLAGKEAEITLRVTRWKRLFSEDQLAGSVAVNGVEYFKADGWRMPNLFYTPHPAGDGTAHAVIPQEVLEWRQNYVMLVLEGRKATLSYSNFPAGEIAQFTFEVGKGK